LSKKLKPVKCSYRQGADEGFQTRKVSTDASEGRLVVGVRILGE